MSHRRMKPTIVSSENIRPEMELGDVLGMVLGGVVAKRRAMVVLSKCARTEPQFSLAVN